MKNKLLTAGVAILLVVVILVTAIGTVGSFLIPKFPGVGDHFTASPKNYMLNVSSTEGGTVNRGSEELLEGTVVDLFATPDEGYIFAGWYSGKNIYLSTSPAYSLTMTENTTIHAKFSPKPEPMSGSAESTKVLQNCGENFSFTVKCDREDAEQYLYENLKIVDAYFAGTEYEDYTAQAFELKDQGNGEFLVTPKEQTYEKGVSYTAVLPHTVVEEENEFGETEEILVPTDATFAISGTESAALDFTIEYEESNVAEHHEGIIFIRHDGSENDPVLELIDDGLVEGDEGDLADKLILSSAYGLTEGSIFCVYDGTEDENGQPVMNMNTLYGKVSEVNEEDGSFCFTYVMPDLNEIFSDLNIAGSGEVDLEGAGVEIDEEALAEQIRYLLYTDEEFKNSVAEAETAIALMAQAYGYEAELIAFSNLADKFNIKVSPRISGSNVKINVTVSFNMPLTKNGKQYASIALSINQVYDISLSSHARAAIQYWWFIPTGSTELDIGITNTVRNTSTVQLSLSDEKDPAGLADLKKNMEQEFTKLLLGGDLQQRPIYNTAKNLLKEGGYSSEANKNWKLCEFRYYIGIFSFDAELSLTLSLDIAGSLSQTTYSSETVTTAGIRQTGNGMKPYSNQSASASCRAESALFVGKVEVRTGVTAKVHVTTDWLIKFIQIDISAGADVYFRAAGFVSFAHAVYGGNIEAGVYVHATFYYKVFSFFGNSASSRVNLPLFRYGYDNAILGYINPTLIHSTPKIGIKQGTPLNLFNLALLRVNYSVTTISMAHLASPFLYWNSLSPTSKDYQIQIGLAENSYLTYNPATGELSVKENAPSYFKETITIQVDSVGAVNWGPRKYLDFATCFVHLPTVQIQVICGNEDDYYAGIDSELQAAFRKLFRNYNENNQDLLMKEIDNLFENVATVSGNYQVIYDNIVRNYIDQLFISIAAGQKMEDENRTVENAFVATEPVAFSGTINMFNRMITEKTVDSEEILSVLDSILNSNVMYDTLILVKDVDGADQLATRFNSLGESLKQEIHEIVDRFDEEHADDPRAGQLSEAFRTFFRFEEEQE